MKKIYRLTETDLRNVIMESVNRILGEDVLGNNWDSEDVDKYGIFNNYEPFGKEKKEEDGEHNFGVKGEKNIDPTQYDDYDPTIEPNIEYNFPGEPDDSDYALYHGSF